MRVARVRRLRRDLDGLRDRKASIRPVELVKLALKLGRKESNRGKEPTYTLAGAFPLTIPKHPGTLPIGTACNTLNTLEHDLERYESDPEQDEDETTQPNEGDEDE